MATLLHVNLKKQTMKKVDKINHNRILFCDIETTGLSYDKGDRIWEIAMIEAIDGELTNNTLHHHINPCREIPEKVIELCQLDIETLNSLLIKPTFREVAQEVLAFINKEPCVLVFHNAKFDTSFIRGEYSLIEQEPLISEIEYFCNLELAREVLPAKTKCSLDALVERYNIDTNRVNCGHGALLDVQLLHKVYNCLVNDV